MKKIFNISLTAVAIMTLAVACNKDVATSPDTNPEEVAPSGETVTIKATLSDALTRVDFTPTITGGKTTSMALAWAQGDKVRVFDHDDRQKYDDFTLAAESVGEKVGVFTGTPTHLAGASSYDVEVVNVINGAEVTDGIIEYSYDFYDKQTQPADGDPGDLKYFAKAKELTDYTDIQFSEISGVLAVAAKLPEGVAGTIKSVDFISSEVLFPGGHELTITLTTPGDAGEDDILNLFATLDAEEVVNYQDVNLIVRFHAPESDHKVYTRFVVLNWPKMSPNNLNTLNINASQSDKHAGKPTDDGSEGSPYLIGDMYQMAAVDKLLKADETVYFRMVDDVDMSGITWVPLNNVTDNNKHYSKYISFDGDNHTLSNITTNATDIPAYPSVFGVLNGKVANLNIDHATITPGENKAGVLAGYIGSSDSNVVPEVFNVHITNSTVGTEAARGTNYLGGVAAQIQKDGTKLSHVTIESSAVYGNLAENKTVGGMIAYIKCGATLENCHSSALVHARAYVGGIVGFTEEPEGKTTLISKCYADESPITATYRYAGGIVGHANGLGTLTISDCYVAANVAATNGWAGGICGDHNRGVTKIINCYSTGEVSASFGAGGIVGQVNADGLDIQKCAVFNAAIKATITDNDPHYSSGAVVAYAKGKKMTINTTYHKAGMTFTECPGNSGNTLPTSNSGISWLNNLEVTQGAHEYIYPYHGRRTTMTLVALTRDTYAWDANVWDFSGDVPTLR